MSRQRTTILVTGFGPFPGAPDNPSEFLVRHMKNQAVHSHPDVSIAYGILPTHWQEVGPALDRLLAQYQPDFSLHIGYADSSPGFELESAAYNQTCHDPDVDGMAGSCGPVVMDFPTQLKSALPLTKLAAHLTASGYAAECSNDPGRYLCNMAYYLSLAHTATRPGSSLFIHIPAIKNDRAVIPLNHPGTAQLSLEEACDGLGVIMTMLAEKTSCAFQRGTPTAYTKITRIMDKQNN